MNRLIQLNPMLEEVTMIEADNKVVQLDDIIKALNIHSRHKVNVIDCMHLGSYEGTNIDLFIDDEGMLRNQVDLIYIHDVFGNHVPVAGNGVIVLSDENGMSFAITDEEMLVYIVENLLIGKVSFINADKIRMAKEWEAK